MQLAVGGVRRRRCSTNLPTRCPCHAASPPTWTKLGSWGWPSATCVCATFSTHVSWVDDHSSPAKYHAGQEMMSYSVFYNNSFQSIFFLSILFEIALVVFLLIHYFAIGDFLQHSLRERRRKRRIPLMRSISRRSLALSWCWMKTGTWSSSLTMSTSSSASLRLVHPLKWKLFFGELVVLIQLAWMYWCNFQSMFHCGSLT